MQSNRTARRAAVVSHPAGDLEDRFTRLEQNVRDLRAALLDQLRDAVDRLPANHPLADEFQAQLARLKGAR